MYIIISSLLILGGIAWWDITQKKHTIRSNFPVIGHIRYLFEKIGPEFRQYFFSNNREELPFSRRHRSWVYASSKGENNLSGFGTDMNLDEPGHVIIKTAVIPSNAAYIGQLPCAKVMGEDARGKRRRLPYHPKSIVNISGMSFGALSGAAVEAMNKGANLASCYHTTGEGGFSVHHNHGADVVFQFGTGYFGVCDEDGNFSMPKLELLVKANPCIKAIEIKLSQGAKPGKGGILPAAKMTKEIADARGIKMGMAAVSPSKHTAFSNMKELVDFVESIAEATGLPVGIKSAVGRTDEWYELAAIMKSTDKGPDFITIDGGEGGTGAAPPSFADHLSLPFNEAFSTVYKIFHSHRLDHRIVFVASGKLGLPANAIKAFALGADIINVAREAMMSIGCIQAQVCHTNRCPSGVATQNKWLTSGLDPELKSVRCANYIKTLRKEIHEITNACGYKHPCEFQSTDVMLSTGDSRRYLTLYELYNVAKRIPQTEKEKELA